MDVTYIMIPRETWLGWCQQNYLPLGLYKETVKQFRKKQMAFLDFFTVSLHSTNGFTRSSILIHAVKDI